MSVRTGFTIVEVLIALGIVALLASLVYVMSGSAREQARQTVCVSQMKSIYQALTLYAADYDNGTNYPELHGLAYVGSRGRNLADVLKPYGFVREFLFCPSSSIRMKEKLGSTYLWPIRSDPIDSSGQVSKSREVLIEREKQQGDSIAVVECHIHDELFFANAESDIDASIASPYRIRLQANGAVKRGRVFPPRTTFFTDMAYGR